MDRAYRNQRELKLLGKEIKLQATIIAVVLLVLWGAHAINMWLFDGELWRAGIHPRELSSIPAIIYAQILHLHTDHLIVNSIALVIFAWLVMLRDTRDFFAVTILSMLVCGVSVWLFSDVPVTRVGSGGIIMGYLGCVLAWALFERNVIAVIVSVVIALVFGGVALETFPLFADGYWIGGFSGLIAGVFASRFMSRHFKSHLTRSLGEE